MGTWGGAPWDNDHAADWFGRLFDETHLRDRVVEGLRSPLQRFETIRAAAHVLVQLGQVYIWPIDSLDQDLELAASRLEEVLEKLHWEEQAGHEDERRVSIRNEIATLRSRKRERAP